MQTMELGRGDVDRLAEQLLEDLSYIRTHTSKTSELLATGVVNHVLEVGTYKLDTIGGASTDGVRSHGWRATCGSAEIENFGSAPIYVNNGGRTTKSTFGMGVSRIDPGVRKTVNVGTRGLTVWGIVGELYGLQAFTVGYNGGAGGLGAIDGGTP